MNKFRAKHRRSPVFPTAVITSIIFAVILWATFNPLEFYKFRVSFRTDFRSSQDFIRFFNVGQADCALIYSNGKCCVIDTGEAVTSNEIAMKLYDCKIESLDTVLISHHHSDHVGGLPQLADIFKIKNLIMPTLQSTSAVSANTGKNIAIKKGAQFYHASQGLNFNIGDFTITLLGAFPDPTNENNRSVFAMAEIDGIKFLFTGDAEIGAEALLLNQRLNLDCDVLKVAHHGSESSTHTEFLDATTPDYAVISVGENNDYGHPNTSTIYSLKNYNAKIFRTDQSGDITFHIKNGEIKVTEENN
jgi:competence protein ComEC